MIVNHQVGTGVQTISFLSSVKNDTYFTVSITLFVFLAGTVAKLLWETYKERKRLKRLKEYFKRQVQLLEASVKKQEEEFLRYVEILTDPEEPTMLFRDVVGFNLKRLLIISDADLYKIFVENGNLKDGERIIHYSKITKNIDVLESIRDKIENNYLNYFEEYRRDERVFYDHVQRSKWLCDKHVNGKGSVTPGSNDFMEKYKKILGEWHKIRDYRRKNVVQKSYLDPMLGLCMKYKFDQEISEILQEIMDAYQNY